MTSTENKTLPIDLDDYNITQEDMEFHLKEGILIKKCNHFTHRLLESGMGLGTTCKIIKNFQKVYIYLYKEASPKIAKAFTIEQYARILNN